MIDEFAHEFWHRRATETDGSIRWTDHQMLEADVALLRPVIPDGAALLDLGCGTGDVFLAVLDMLGSVTAVDIVAEFLDRIPSDPKIRKVVSTVNDFVPDREYDAALLFGVVTHLDPADEIATYHTLRRAVPNGTVVIKNQCGRDHDVNVDGWSEAFGGRYVARYPHVDKQAEQLREIFGEVEVMLYPEAVNKWADSHHAAFVCRA